VQARVTGNSFDTKNFHEKRKKKKKNRLTKTVSLSFLGASVAKLLLCIHARRFIFIYLFF